MSAAASIRCCPAGSTNGCGRRAWVLERRPRELRWPKKIRPPGGGRQTQLGSVRSYCLLIESSPLFAEDFFDFFDFLLLIFDISLLLMLSPPAAGAAAPLS